MRCTHSTAMMTKPQISIVVAVGRDKGRNHVIGRGNELLWRISDDLRRFKQITMGHPVIMGRKTFESIGRPLPGRTNIVVTRDKTWKAGDVCAAHSLDEALALARSLDSDEIFICGGAQVYEQALPFAAKLYLTRVDVEKEGDAHFPPFEHIFTKKTFEEKRFDEKTGLHYTWENFERS